MIHDPEVEVTCDEEGCMESTFVRLRISYPSLSGSGGSYKVDDDKIGDELLEKDWTVVDDKHYCPGCSD